MGWDFLWQGSYGTKTNPILMGINSLAKAGQIAKFPWNIVQKCHFFKYIFQKCL